MDTQAVKRRAAGVIGLGVVAGIVATLIGVYDQAFTSKVPVTLVTARSGLLLDKGSDVRLDGLRVGQVHDVKLLSDDQVAVGLDLYPSDIDKIPSNVSAKIEGTTVFGGKYVALTRPFQPSSDHIEAAARIDATHTTVEANDVFDNAMKVLTAVDPQALNTTLTEVASALQGRGQELGQLITEVNSYLAAFNPHLGDLGTDFRLSAGVLRTYADVMPDFIATASQASTTSRTLDSNTAALDAFLVDTVSAARAGTTFFSDLEQPLVDALKAMTPVSDLFQVYSPELGCLVDTLAYHSNAVALVLGHQVPGIQGKAGFFPGQSTYKYPENLPKFITNVGPICYPHTAAQNTHPPHIRFDDGTKNVYDGVAPEVDPGTLHDPYGNKVTFPVSGTGGARAATTSADLDLVTKLLGSKSAGRLAGTLARSGKAGR